MTTHDEFQNPRTRASARPSADTQALEHPQDGTKPRSRPVVRTSPTRMLSPVDVTELLQVSIKTVRRWIDAGELRVHRLGRQLRISTEDLDAFIKQRRE